MFDKGRNVYVKSRHQIRISHLGYNPTQSQPYLTEVSMYSTYRQWFWPTANSGTPTINKTIVPKIPAISMGTVPMIGAKACLKVEQRSFETQSL